MHEIHFKQEDDPCEYFYFSGGEPHAKVPTIADDQVYIRVYDLSWEDYGHLLCLMSALIHQNKKITLAIPYFPGARQDRNPGGNSPLTVAIYSDHIAHYADRVIVCDMHSPRALGHLNAHVMNAYGTLSHITVDEIFSLWKNHFSHITHVIAPDEGAMDRASRAAGVLGVPVITCEKVREFDTGHITAYQILADKLDPGSYLVVDDICDGGATFEILASSFFATVGPMKHKYDLSLYVTHPIFSKGLNALFQVYDHVYTTNSRNFETHIAGKAMLTILDLDPLLKGVLDNELHVQH